MTDYIYSVVIIVPAEFKEDADRLSIAIGHGAPTHVAPSSPTGEAPATHYGCRATAIQSFRDLLDGAQGGAIPPVYGMTEQEVIDVLSAMIVDWRLASEAAGHYDDVLAVNSLERVIVPDIVE